MEISYSMDVCSNIDLMFGALKIGVEKRYEMDLSCVGVAYHIPYTAAWKAKIGNKKYLIDVFCMEQIWKRAREVNPSTADSTKIMPATKVPKSICEYAMKCSTPDQYLEKFAKYLRITPLIRRSGFDFLCSERQKLEFNRCSRENKGIKNF